MKGRLIALDHLDGAEAAALMVDGRLEDLFLDSDAPRPGAIYRGIADRPVKGQGGMFLRTPDGPAFLRQIKGLRPGQPILVQVTGYPEPGKALPVTAKVLFKSRYAIVTPDAPGLNMSRSIRDDDRRDVLLAIAHEEMGDSDMGLILRSSCAEAADDEIAEDIRTMQDLAQAVTGDADGTGPEKLTEGDGPHALAWQGWSAPAQVDTAPGSFADHGVLDQIDALRVADAPLGGGASMSVEPTRALVAVDVNTGGDTSPAAGLKANLAAARDLPRQLRLRGLGGQVVMDPAPMAKKDRRQFETTLRAAFRADIVETALVGWTPLGHFELQRKRDRIPLSEVIR
ncbi:ribonuclease, Rne/Rng family [Roseovarius pacificus]|uniref:Ribonuclease, Rne/Rng family n=1 Tax=Roseovarius pacificus TaxID=337701 RepID=A0A1M6YWA4_9RHOB|nr:ribonuclease E/G [Roseovarius pacificus]GGO50285.1 ribonuclease G [Roseovarius pacificus]SHL22528.1 ribonuclease, Rne/Rng family [Roseovarius pacificus]